jgi:predicted dehydrogenase
MKKREAKMKTLRFGIIGCGMMGRMFASAAARWGDLLGDIPRPEIIAVANRSEPPMGWFKKNVPGLRLATSDYTEILKREDVDAVYCAVPHNQHEKVYTDIIRAGKHLMGEKPFGIDAQANANILAALAEKPDLFCRCSSQFAFYPGMKKMIDWIEKKRFGKIIEVRAGFLHSSDMDLNKPANWKRMKEKNGEYGCMGDLGMHIQYVPIRYGWVSERVSAYLNNIVTERPDGRGGMMRCDTYENADLLCRAKEPDGNEFPMTFEMKRMSPGSTNVWYLKVLGMKASACFSTDDPGAFSFLASDGTEQAWSRINVGYRPQFETIYDGILEFGVGDAVLQMWAAFMAEFAGREVAFGCARPEETAQSHAVLSAALRSYKERTQAEVNYE